jgi:hypothetical protein
VVTRVGIPSVWESTAAKYLVARIELNLRGSDPREQPARPPVPGRLCRRGTTRRGGSYDASYLT